jgi:hypothetical protein
MNRIRHNHIRGFFLPTQEEAAAQGLIAQALPESDGGRVGNLEAIEILRQIWNGFSMAYICKSWPICDDFKPDEDDTNTPWEP